MTIAMDELCSPSPCESVTSSTRRLPRDLKRNGARASLVLRAVGVGPARPHRAQEGAEPVPARVPIRWLASDRGAGSAYAEGQRWTRDPRGSRVRSDSPRIPHDKVTQWLRPIKIPCQGAIRFGKQRASTPLSRTKVPLTRANTGNRREVRTSRRFSVSGCWFAFGDG